MMREADASLGGPEFIQAKGYSRFFAGTLFAGFIATGAATVLLAPMLPLLSSKWNLSDQSAGALFTSQFVGSMLGTLLSGYFVQRGGFGKTLFAGYVLMALNAAGILLTTWPWLAALLFINGIGLGMVIPATNMAVSDAFPANRASALNLINLSWSVGAIVCPATLAAAARFCQLQQATFGIAAVLFVLALLIVRAPKLHQIRKKTLSSTRLSRISSAILALLFFLYIGVEGSVAGWLATYAKRTVLPSGVLWMTAPSFFWAAIMAGRALAPLILRRIEERYVLIGGLAVSGVGVAAVLAGNSTASILTGTVISGLGMSSVFPIFIAMISQYFRELSTRVSPYMFAMAGLGGAVLPWVVGTVSSQTGKLRAGLTIALVGVALQLILSLLLVTRDPARNPTTLA
jgi:fucose permease